MNHTNIEIKAKINNEKRDEIKQYLEKNKTAYIGKDNQTDIYFKSNNGLLKLRKSDFESERGLIYYNREIKKQDKKSETLIYRKEDDTLKKILEKSIGIDIEVEKQREIYFIDNVKFHLDYVKNLGSFMEIEAISEEGNISEEKLKEQCKYYRELFGIKQEDLIEDSYAKMLRK